jgi:hypothetical protein
MIKTFGFIAMGITLGVLVFCYQPHNDNFNKQLVLTALEDKSYFKQIVDSEFGDKEFYSRSTRYFKEESIESMSITVEKEISTILDLVLGQRTFRVIINKGAEAEYLIDVIIRDDLQYRIEEFYLRIQ